MTTDNHATIEKALLADICLGLPIGKIMFDLPESAETDSELAAPDLYLFRGEQLALLKRLYQTGDNPQVSAAVEALTQSADKLLSGPPASVTDKPSSRFSARANDYQSLAKYYWPNPDSADGLPYLRRDGDINPECYSDDFDYLRLVGLSEKTVLLAVTAYLLDDRQYGDGARHLLETWFLDEHTRQTAHFRYAQTRPGTQTEGNWPGIVEARFLIYVTEAIRLLFEGGFLDRKTFQGLQSWFGELLDWMLQSSQGENARKADNNIGFWTDLQCVIYAAFCEREALASRILHERIAPRLRRQIESDGSLPHELMRAHPHDYVAFSLVAMALISRAGENEGTALWSQPQGDGRNFQMAHDWLLGATRAPETLAALFPHPRATHAGTFDLSKLMDVGIKLRMVDRLARSAQLHSQVEQEDNLNRHRELLDYALQLEEALQRIRTTRSWRITAPARAVGRLLQKALTGSSHQTISLPRPPLEIREAAGEYRLAKRKDFHAEGRAALAGFRQTIGTFGRRAERAAKNRLRALLHPRPSPEAHLEALRRFRPQNDMQLRQEYEKSALSREPDTFVLYRIIGNDLYPRHRKGQSFDNLAFLLEHEERLPGCEKRWVVNRIVDPEEERRIIDLLERFQQSYIHIPFIADEYRAIGLDYDALPRPDYQETEAFARLRPEEQDRCRTALYRLKNNYVMNNNGARNAALQDGRKRAKWVLPWDGNCFITPQAWQQIVADVTSRPHLKYFAVPMERALDNNDLLRDGYRPNPVEEPQLLFRRDAAETFNPDIPYGRRPKVELFWRLGIPGPWDYWGDDPWDQPRRPLSKEAGQFGAAGWVARMFSGVKQLESSSKASGNRRMRARNSAIIDAIHAVDITVSKRPSERAPN